MAWLLQALQKPCKVLNSICVMTGVLSILGVFSRLECCEQHLRGRGLWCSLSYSLSLGFWFMSNTFTPAASKGQFCTPFMCTSVLEGYLCNRKGWETVDKSVNPTYVKVWISVLKVLRSKWFSELMISVCWISIEKASLLLKRLTWSSLVHHSALYVLFIFVKAYILKCNSSLAKESFQLSLWYQICLYLLQYQLYLFAFLIL